MDRRIRKTKQAIVTAFLELLDEKKDIDKISITDITKRADISRSTFYFHYNGTYELVDEICDSFTKQIYSIILKAHSDMPGENCITRSSPTSMKTRRPRVSCSCPRKKRT